MRVSVVVPARDAAGTIERCIRCLAAQDLGDPFEVVLVDDRSGDDTVAAAARAGFPIRVVAGDGSGPAAARNLGAEAAEAPVLAFLDADCFPTPGWLRAGLRALEDADLVQGRVVPDPDFVRGPFDRTLHVDGPSPLYESANLFARRDLFERLGGFEAWLEPEVGKAVAEDVWFGWRARRKAARIAFAPDALVHHAVFREGALAHVLDRRRLAHFPALAAKVPELRDHFFWGGTFLSPRSAAFDLALLGVATRRRALALPYALLLAREAAGWGRLAPQVLPVRLAADAVGFAALVRGSLKRRSVVL